MKLYIQICVIAVLLLNKVTAQTTYNVNGSVTDAHSGAPLAGATVYISNSSKGDVTNEKGAYSITGLLNGKYDLIVSYVGFQTEIYGLNIEGKNVQVSFKLNRAPKALAEIIVKIDSKTLQRRFETFFNAFIGTDKIARHTHIINPEVIHLTEKAGVLIAQSKAPLIIENKDMGYSIQYLLKNFTYDQKKGDLQYFGYPYFEEMKTQKRSEQRKWERNREKAYRVSRLRFFRTLGEQRLIEQGYIVGSLTPKEQKLSIISLRGKITKSNTFDITLFNGKYQDSLFWPEVPYDSIMNQFPDGRYLLDFNGLLSVDATLALGHAVEAGDYVPGQNFSVISIKKPVVVNEYGLPDNPFDIVVYGDWVNMRIAWLLPFNYEPALNK